MSIAAAEKLQKVRKYSAALRNLLVFFFVFVCLFWTIFSIVLLVRAPYFRVMSYLYWTVELTVVLKIVFHLSRLFHLYAEGKIFSAENVQQIRRIGITLLVLPALRVMGLFVPVFVPIGGAAGGGRLPVAQVVSAILANLVFATIVIVVSWVMDVGRELREEQDLVV